MSHHLKKIIPGFNFRLNQSKYIICIRVKFTSLRKQPSFIAPGPSGSRETPLGPGAMKDGCFRRLKVYTSPFVFSGK